MIAARAARAEATAWAALAGDGDLTATEAAVVVFHDPRADLERRARGWGYPLGTGDLADLALFAAALAVTEAEAWEGDEPHIATRAYEERRFLAGDRILHWAVPWLDAVGMSTAELLGIGDRLRPAPRLAAGEGTVIPGHDEIGPLDAGVPLADLLRSLWSGLVLLGPAEPGPALAARYGAAAHRWEALAAAHPGSAALWAALSRRAATTAMRLRGSSSR